MALNPFDEQLEDLDQSPAPTQQTTPAAPVYKPAPAPVDPLDAAIADYQHGRESQLRAATIGSIDKSPDRAARALQLAHRLDIPVPMVERNFDQIERRAKIADTPYAQMLRESPSLVEWVTSQPDRAPAVADDMDNMGFLEWLTTAPQRAFARKNVEEQWANLTWESLHRPLSKDEQATLATLTTQRTEGGDLGAGNSWWRGAILGMPELIQQFGSQIMGSLHYAIPAGITAATGAALVGQIPPLTVAPEEVVTVPVAFAGGVTAGLMTGGFEYTQKLEAANAYEEYLKFKDPITGQGIDPALAKSMAISAGFTNALIETGALGFLTKKLPFLNRLASAGTQPMKDAVIRNLLQPTMRAAFTQAVKTYAITVGTETGQEVAQRLATIAFGEAGKALNEKPVPFRSMKDIAEDLAQEGAGAFQSFALGLLPAPMMEYGAHFSAARRAQANRSFFDALAEGAKNSKTIQRLPEAAQDFIAAATKDGPVEHVYIDLAEWNQYWQSQAVDPKEMATALTGSATAYDDATAAEQQLKIPTARYAVKLAGTPHNAFFGNELRFGPDDMNAREQQAFVEHQAELFERAKTVDAERTPEQRAAAAVKAAVAEMLVKSGKYTASSAEVNALLHEAFFGTIGEKAGVDPVTLFNRYGLKVTSDLTGTSEVPASAPNGTSTGAVEGAPTGDLLAPGREGEVPAGAQGEAGTGSVEAAAKDATLPGSDGTQGPTAEDRPAGARPGDAGGQREPGVIAADSPAVGADVSGVRAEPAAAVGGGADPSGSLAGPTPEGRAAAVPASYRPTFDGLLAGARELGFTGSDDDLAHLFLDQLQQAQAVVRELADIEGGWKDLLHEVAAAGGIGIDAATEQKAEVEALFDAAMPNRLTTRVYKGKKSRFFGESYTHRTPMSKHLKLAGIKGVLKDKGQGGRSLDDVLTELNSSGPFEGQFEDLSAFHTAVLDAIDMATGKAGEQSVVSDVISALEGALQVTPESRWWDYATYNQPAFHGSAHVFEQFSLHAIGTGEGAQAYGWGLYFAGQKDVAEFYRDKLAGTRKTAYVRGEPVEGFGFYEAHLRNIAEALDHGVLWQKAKEDTLADLDYRIVSELRWLREDGRDVVGPNAVPMRERANTTIAEVKDAIAKIEALKESDVTMRQPGRTYHVEIPGNETMLDWDAPASKQPAVVQDALRRLGIHWSPFRVRTLAEMTEWLNGPEAEAIWRGKRSDPGWGSVGTDIDREDIETARALAVHGDEAALERWQWKHQRLLGGVNEPTGAIAYAALKQIIQKSQGSLDKFGLGSFGGFNFALRDDEGASKVLAAAGVTGIRYLDGLSRGSGAGSHNYVIFDDKLVQITEYDQAAKREPVQMVDLFSTGEQQPRLPGDVGAVRDQEVQQPKLGEVKDDFKLTAPEETQATQTTLFQGREQPTLIIQHNLTARNLAHAVKIGGIPVPSLAITKAADAMTNFGEITLLGPREMADPQGYAKTQVFGADIYSPRYPTIHYKLSLAGEKRVSELIKANPEGGETYYDLDELQKKGAEYLKTVNAVMVAFLKEQGVVDIPAPVLEADQRGGPPRFSDRYATRRQLEALVDDHGGTEKFEAYARKLFESLGPSEHIFRGFTNQGNRSYKAHTVENVVAELKKEMRGGESSSNLYGVGQLRAKFTPRFKSLAQIQKAKGSILSAADFDAVKEEVNAEVFAITDALEAYYPHKPGFGFVDTVMAVMEEAPKRGIAGALREYEFADVPAELQQRIGEYLVRLRNLPTEYFEAKILRAVDLAEFRAAVVPADASPSTIQMLEARGIEVTTYQNAAERKQVTRDVAERLAEQVMFQDEPKGRRGFIRFGPDRKFDINLLERSDLSTFLHESGHFFLEVLGDVADALKALDQATLTDGQRQVIADYETLLAWLGVKDRSEIGKDQHEQFATALEAYTMAGQAPSIALRSAFARFRAWLTGFVYRGLKQLHVTLTPEVTKVMDRLLASDKAIEENDQLGHIEPMFLTQAQAGMSDEEYARYQRSVGTAVIAQREKLDRQLMAEVERETQREWKDRKAAVEDTVTSEIQAQPAYRAMAAMSRGTSPAGESLTEGEKPVPMRLSKDILVERFGKDRLKALPKYLYTVEGGVDPDLVAQMFGFSSGDELLHAVAGAVPMRKAIDEETARRMNQQYGSILLDGTIDDKAKAALATRERELVLREELRALAKQQRRKAGSGPATIRAAMPALDAVNAVAEDRIARTAVKSLTPSMFWSAARRASKEAVEAAAKQDFAAAIVAKQQELLNLAMFRQASDAVDDVEARVQRARGMSSKSVLAVLGKAGDSYVDQVQALLERFDFETRTKRDLNRRQASIEKWAAGEREDGMPMDLPREVLQDTRTPYQNLTLEEFIGVTDALEHILHIARKKVAGIKAQADVEYKVLRDRLEQSIRMFTPTRDQKLYGRTSKDRAVRKVANWFASHAKLSFLARAMDGNQDGGAMWDLLIRPLNEADDAERTRRRDAAAKWKSIISEHYSTEDMAQMGRKSGAVFIPAVGDSLTKEERLAVLLNWGNEGNRARLLNDPARKLNRVQVQAILDTLDERDGRFAQATWDFLDEFWPDIVAKMKRVTGLTPLKVEASAFETKFGTLRGGYYPITYDGTLEPRADQVKKISESGLAAMAGYVRQTTRRGHEEARKDNVKLPLKLDLTAVTNHIDQVIHDLTHHEVLIDTARLLRDPKVRAAILETQGDLVYAQFTDALTDIALGYIPTRDIFDEAAAFARKGTQVALLGYNLWTGAQQPLGLFNGMQRVGPTWVLRGLRRWLRDAASFEHTLTWIREVSPMMRGRGGNVTVDIADLRTAFSKPGGWFDTLVRKMSADKLTQEHILDSFLWHIAVMQNVADVPTWLGAYEKAMAGDADEDRAVALADQAVIDSQGSGSIKDLAKIQRGRQIARLFMTFYSYGNLVFNQTHLAVKSVRSWKNPAQLTKLTADLSLIYLMPAIGTVALGRAFGKTPGDDWPDWFKDVALEGLGSAFNTMVILREFAGMLKDGNRGYSGPAATRIFQAIYSLGDQVKQMEPDEALLKALNQVGGIVFRYPAAQVQRFADGAAALADGRSSNPLVLLFGPPPKGQ